MEQRSQTSRPHQARPFPRNISFDSDQRLADLLKDLPVNKPILPNMTSPWVDPGPWSTKHNMPAKDVPEAEKLVCDSKPHFHRDNRGALVRCYYKCKKNAMMPVWWILSTVVAFPFEHYLYEKVWPFTLLTKWLGL